MEKAYWGLQFSEVEISNQLAVSSEKLEKQNCIIAHIQNEGELCKKTAKEIGSNLLTLINIQDEVAILRKKLTDKLKITAEKVLAEV